MTYKDSTVKVYFSNGKIIASEGFCYVCGKEPSQWVGYANDQNGRNMDFCENCKMKWIKFAEKYGAQFAPHGNTFGVKDGKCACITNLLKEEILCLWKLFLQKDSPFIFR